MKVRFNTISCCAKWSVQPGDVIEVTDQEGKDLIAGNYATATQELFAPFFGEQSPESASKQMQSEVAVLDKPAENAERPQSRKSITRQTEREMINQSNAKQ